MRSVLVASILLVPAIAAGQPDEEEIDIDVEADVDGESGGEGGANGETAPPEGEGEGEGEGAIAPGTRGGLPGDLGVGGHLTLAGMAGWQVRYQHSPEIGLAGTVLAQFSTADGYADAIGAAFSVTYALKQYDDGSIAVGGGLQLIDGAVGESSATGSVDATQIGLFGGIQGEWFVDPALSLHVQAGLGFAYTFGSVGMTDFSGTSVRLGGDALATAGFTYWL